MRKHYYRPLSIYWSIQDSLSILPCIILLSVSKCLHSHPQIKSLKKYVFSYYLHELQQDLLKILANVSPVLSPKPRCCYVATTKALKNMMKALWWMLCRCTEKMHRHS